MPASATLSPPRARSRSRGPRVFSPQPTSSVPLRWKSNSAGTHRLLRPSNPGFQPFISNVCSPEGAHQEDFAPTPPEDSYSPQICDHTVPPPPPALPLCVFSYRHFIYIQFSKRIHAIHSVGLHRQAAASSLTKSALHYTVLFTLHLHASLCSRITHGTFQL